MRARPRRQVARRGPTSSPAARPRGSGDRVGRARARRRGARARRPRSRHASTTKPQPRRPLVPPVAEQLGVERADAQPAAGDALARRGRRSPRRRRAPARAPRRGRRRAPSTRHGLCSCSVRRWRVAVGAARRVAVVAPDELDRSARSIGTSSGPAGGADRAQVVGRAEAEDVGQVDARRVHARLPRAAGPATARARTPGSQNPPRQPPPKRRAVRVDRRSAPAGARRASVASSGSTACVADDVHAACGASAPSRSPPSAVEALGRPRVVAAPSARARARRRLVRRAAAARVERVRRRCAPRAGTRRKRSPTPGRRELVARAPASATASARARASSTSSSGRYDVAIASHSHSSPNGHVP